MKEATELEEIESPNKHVIVAADFSSQYNDYTRAENAMASFDSTQKKIDDPDKFERSDKKSAKAYEDDSMSMLSNEPVTRPEKPNRPGNFSLFIPSQARVRNKNKVQSKLQSSHKI